jgi:hypothetical protein
VSYDGGQVVHLPVRDIDEGVDVLLVMVAGVRPTARVQAFTRYCGEILPDVPHAVHKLNLD